MPTVCFCYFHFVFLSIAKKLRFNQIDTSSVLRKNISNVADTGSDSRLMCVFQVVRRDLMHALKKKRPEKADDIENVIYHHDNAPPHKSAYTELEMALIGFQRIQHPPYSPDLAPLDFAYFPLLKSHLRGRKFNNEQEIRNAVKTFNLSLDKQWFSSVFDKWVKRHERCISHGGAYFEKE